MFLENKISCSLTLLAYALFVFSTYGDQDLEHAVWRTSKRPAGEQQGGQATAVLDREPAGLVRQCGGGVSSAQHRR
jgi:hypothetical protein